MRDVNSTSTQPSIKLNTNDDPGSKTRETTESTNKFSSAFETFVTSKDTVSAAIWYTMSSEKYDKNDIDHFKLFPDGNINRKMDVTKPSEDSRTTPRNARKIVLDESSKHGTFVPTTKPQTHSRSPSSKPYVKNKQKKTKDWNNLQYLLD